MHLELDERTKDLCQLLMAFIEDNLPRNNGVTHEDKGHKEVPKTRITKKYRRQGLQRSTEDKSHKEVLKTRVTKKY